MRFFPQLLFGVAALGALLLVAPARGWDAPSGPLLDPGRARIDLAGGGLLLERDWSWGLEASLRVGLAPRLEIAAPLALGVCLVGNDEGSGLILGGGLVDLWITEQRKLLLSPAVVLAGQLRVAHYASLRLAVDLTGVERGFFTGRHPGWFRGSMALLIDVGPWLTAAAGFSHQRRAFGGEAPAGTRRAGWVGDARFSVGAVRTHPFAELPTLAVHVVQWLDIIALVRADIDLDTQTTDLRLLGGVALKL